MPWTHNMKLKVENETLIRDTGSNAILETDSFKLQRHRSIRKAMQQESNKLNELADKIAKLEELIENLTNKSIRNN